MGLNIAAGGNLDLTGATLGLNSTNILSITGGSLTLGALTFRHVRKIFRGGNKSPATCSSGGGGQVPSF